MALDALAGMVGEDGSAMRLAVPTGGPGLGCWLVSSPLAYLDPGVGMGWILRAL